MTSRDPPGRRGSGSSGRRFGPALAATRFALRAPGRVARPMSPGLALVVGFAILITLGTVVLMLPISSADGSWTSFVDAAFTATSAACVTGLVVVDTATQWSPFGQVAILLLVQVGGFGFMTGSTLLLLVAAGRRSRLTDRLLAQAVVAAPTLGSVPKLVRRVAIFTLIAEGLGALLLAVGFFANGFALPTAAWWAVFHSVSAFNNAGFDLTGNFQSLEPFAGNTVVLMTVVALIVLGGLGVGIVDDLARRRRWVMLTIETKMVLVTTGVLLLGGAVLVGALEWDNPATLGALAVADRPVNALFHSASLRSAGFASVPVGGLTEATLFLSMALMFIGGASGSTAGGIKVTMFGVLLVAIISTARGRPSAEAFGRRIPHSVVYRALSVALLSIALVVGIAFLLQVASGRGLVDVLFETVSAFGTAGLTTGITPELNGDARALLAITMFIGRLGPLTLALALAARARPAHHQLAVETVRIG
jgi:trk system potassium uptake protein TrkH